ncbi:hypothetical protein [Acinetobacter colistiniresistens]|uniref:hypothetical protein n=1 Tax=Acinetobacter colistiniresistens TaxID=280145 RepID=UPI00125032D7|nr:hypothetical protein [Acinetobacter colistiniresistens]
MENEKPKILLNFSKGDAVYMVGTDEAKLPENQKTWICASDSFIGESGDELVFLEGYTGAYMCMYLDYVM